MPNDPTSAAARENIFSDLGFAAGVLLGLIHSAEKPEVVQEAHDKLERAGDWLRRHLAPPGDGGGERVTEEWLRSMGFVPAGTKRYGLIAAGLLIVFPPCGGLDWFTAIFDSGTERTIPVKSGQPTRRDVLNLLSALGIKPSTPQPAGEQP